MNAYQIITDSGCDLPKEMIRELNVRVISLGLLFRGKERQDSVDGHIKELYDAFRSGEAASTTAINPRQWSEVMEEYLCQDQDVLVMVFSSGLSTTYQCAVMAAEELGEKYPHRCISVIDTRCASLGQGLLVWYACHKRDAGMDIGQLTAWLEDMKLHLCHWFTVDDLMYLKRGGRISAATAVVGTMLQIKPLLHVDDEGHLINVGKVRGRRASIEAIADKMGETGWPGQNDTVFICHGDCLEDAKRLEVLVRGKFGVSNVIIGYTGAVIGSHSGPGTLALFYLGEHR